MAEEIEFENYHFLNFKSRDLDPDLRWPWKSHRRECLIDLNKYHYLVCGCIVFDRGRMDGQTDIFTGFIRSSLRRWPKPCRLYKLAFAFMTGHWVIYR